MLNYKKPAPWLVLILLILCVAIAVGLLTDPKPNRHQASTGASQDALGNPEPDLSFLNPDNLLSILSERTRIPVKKHGGITYIGQEELCEWIDQTQWQQMEQTMETKVKIDPEYRIIIGESPRMEIQWSTKAKNSVWIAYDQQMRCYQIPEDAFGRLVIMVASKDYFELESTGQEVQAFLNTIMSLPATSANPGDYIAAHQDAYEDIIKMGQPALNFMLTLFDQGGQTGLQGHIMRALCTDLLGEHDMSLKPCLGPMTQDRLGMMRYSVHQRKG